MPNSEYNVDQISLRFVKPGSGIPAFTIDNWTTYSFESDFFFPSDSFSFECSDDRAEELAKKINISDPVELVVNGIVECKGMIEKVDFTYNKAGGSSLKLSGRDMLGIVIDGTIDPTLKIAETQTFGYALTKAFESAGFTADQIIFSNVDSTARMGTQSYKKTKVAKDGKSGSGSTTITKVSNPIKSHKNEGFMEFARRICKQNGWNIKLTPDGKYIDISMPEYSNSDIDPTLIHVLTQPNNNNIITGSTSINWQKIPSYIIGEATGAGGNNRKGINKVFVPNVLLLDQQEITINIHSKNYSKLKLVSPVDDRMINNLPIILVNLFPGPISINDSYSINKALRPLYLYDDECKTLKALEYKMRRTMADFQNNMFQVNYTVAGHSFKTSDGNFANYSINTMCKVIDDTYKFDNSFWIQKRAFHKSRSGGTITNLTLKLPYIYVFPDIL